MTNQFPAMIDAEQKGLNFFFRVGPTLTRYTLGGRVESSGEMVAIIKLKLIEDIFQRGSCVFNTFSPTETYTTKCGI